MQKIVISRNKEVNFKQLLLFEPYQEEVYISLWNCQTTTRQTKEIQHFACCVNGPDIRAVWILRVQSISTCTKCVSRIKNDKSEISSLLLKLIPSVSTVLSCYWLWFLLHLFQNDPLSRNLSLKMYCEFNFILNSVKYKPLDVQQAKRN